MHQRCSEWRNLEGLAADLGGEIRVGGEGERQRPAERPDATSMRMQCAPDSASAEASLEHAPRKRRRQKLIR